MKLHGNAALSLNQRRRMAGRIVGQGWSIAEAAEAAEVSDPTWRASARLSRRCIITRATKRVAARSKRASRRSANTTRTRNASSSRTWCSSRAAASISVVLAQERPAKPRVRVPLSRNERMFA